MVCSFVSCWNKYSVNKISVKICKYGRKQWKNKDVPITTRSCKQGTQARSSICTVYCWYHGTTKYVYIKSTTVYVPSSELGLPQPLSSQGVCPSPHNQGGGHTRMRVRGWGSPNSEDWRKSFALFLLCVGVWNGTPAICWKYYNGSMEETRPFSPHFQMLIKHFS